MSNLQQQASNPNTSVWVSASAGTGKTKILIDRFLRLLITGTEPTNILCLTFTNAAAIEMQARINSKLKYLALCDAEKLENELFLMSGNKPLPQEIANTKTLYYKLLNSHEPLNIYTIHAFCQKILKTFPLEAGITPEFKILEETKLQDIFLKIKNEIYLSDEHNEVIQILLNRFHEITLQDIFTEIIEQKIKFKKLFINKQIPEQISNKRLALEQLNNIYDKVASLFTAYDLAIAPKTLFFTKDGGKRKRLLSKELTKKYPQLLTELEKITAKIHHLDELRRIEELKYHTNLLTKLAYIFLKKYDSYKEENNLLDYDDLIYYTEKLLNNKTTHEWLFHKFENEINHILIDEAQDTSPTQWNIITTLITKLNVAEKPSNSTFIVGDDKQSIFRFQGANLHNFNLVNDQLKINLTSNNKKFKNITLEYSYRSCPEILQFTHNVLNNIKSNYPNLFLADNPLISSLRIHQGSVTVWPLLTNQKQKEFFWTLPEDDKNAKSAADLLIDKIVNFIKEKIKSKGILTSTASRISEKDFMILVRKRDKFSHNLIKELSKAKLKVEISDRINLKENLPILDLIAAAKFVLLPDDDLNLACLLKSPIIGISEQKLYTLLVKKNDHTLWEVLSSHKDIYHKLDSIIEIYKIATAENFFDLLVNRLNLRAIYGKNTDDMINDLLTLSKDYANSIDNSLQGFIAWFENNDIYIKRDMEHSDKIRVMTVHGSKGLEAPFVILCDSTTLPIRSNKFIWDDNGQMFFSLNSEDTPAFLQELKESEKLKDLQEYMRLLYVAMTRAQDHLIICGFSNKDTIPENCWYKIAKQTFDKLLN
ncbi:ATP-dependent nuclease subunit A (addA) [Rickettsia prowazekii str. GvV257]|uniref:DNA 3'-5' helicase n=2 Tax=Rickettsia prowazekii TaxID=782 RepID=Q9ZCJ7_RICPR|nr:exodeoxyribonuclease V subunit beta [Rickettsia prowazekii]EOB10344.1 Malonyl CoA-acyl carrier protein transacylase [Rickettsia prowazekii str. GvF12]ADE30291.1 ATP-dependent helicase [Rickettsia prowazekii str. Rp22]AFE49531.1 ATP-dependent nuclease subunit A (addA) [Rickettsia prowazekii str. Chernikova]AFE50375.1 ATP-dependent nuclease subunit A (addA) [Rickettsia prowazekii str. Katsinyian]AFE51220.1 ATP-dependent nuclease subunit A (addA) [Rickettsia prowazekii str. BuV67-CWPP]